MKDLSALLSHNIGAHLTVQIGTDLVHAGRLEELVVTDERIILINKLGAVYYLVHVLTWELVGEQTVQITHTDNTITTIDVRD